jgi:hypothetical protein
LESYLGLSRREIIFPFLTGLPSAL